MDQLGPFPGRMSIYTQRLVDHLREGKPGDTMTREQATAICGRDCSSHAADGCRSVSTAIHHVQSNYSLIWIWDRGIGSWRCLSDSEIPEHVMDARVKKARKQARRALSAAKCVQRSQLTPEIAARYDATSTIAGLLLVCTERAVRKELRARNVNVVPDQKKVLQLFT